MLDSFSIGRTGNWISLIFFSLILLLLLYNIFFSNDFKVSSSVILLITGIFSLLFLSLSILFTDKDYKIYSSALFLILEAFLLVVLITTTFSRSKKIHFFNNIGLLLILAISGFLINLYFIYNYKDDSDAYINGNKKADAGVVLGAAVWGGNRPSPVLRERINKGFEIYEKKIVPKLVLTGGGSPNEMTEAEVAKNELKKYGVEEKNLLIEVKSNSTNEQIHFVRDRYYRKLNWKKIILISDNFHLYRASEICRFSGMNVDCIASNTPLTTESYLNFCIKESFAVLLFWIFGIG